MDRDSFHAVHLFPLKLPAAYSGGPPFAFTVRVHQAKLAGGLYTSSARIAPRTLIHPVNLKVEAVHVHR